MGYQALKGLPLSLRTEEELHSVVPEPRSRHSGAHLKEGTAVADAEGTATIRGYRLVEFHLHAFTTDLAALSCNTAILQNEKHGKVNRVTRGAIFEFLHKSDSG
ncbi:MAG TPA: hypothetical protein VMU57_04350 [Edaphobacter sp.]|nr:hypothetical protein [Edaphobacter sp.]HUZ94122.1 hypothetical protein [Edaphobacter sp.]